MISDKGEKELKKSAVKAIQNNHHSDQDPIELIDDPDDPLDEHINDSDDIDDEVESDEYSDCESDDLEVDTSRCVVCDKPKNIDEMAFIEIEMVFDTVKRYENYCLSCKDVKKRCGTIDLGCHKLKSLKEFSKSTNGLFGRHTYCRVCRKTQRKLLNNPRPAKGSLIYCGDCDKYLDESNFHSDVRSDNGLQQYCKESKSRMQAKRHSTLDGFLKKLWKDLNKNAKHRKIDVSITLKDIIDLYKKQNGLCALTGRVLTHTSEPRTKGSNRNKHPDNISVDRIDSSKVYTVENIQLVCSSENTFKQDKTMEECKSLHMNVVLNRLSNVPSDKLNSLISAMLKFDVDNSVMYDIKKCVGDDAKSDNVIKPTDAKSDNVIKPTDDKPINKVGKKRLKSMILSDN